MELEESQNIDNNHDFKKDREVGAVTSQQDRLRVRSWIHVLLVSVWVSCHRSWDRIQLTPVTLSAVGSEYTRKMVHDKKKQQQQLKTFPCALKERRRRQRRLPSDSKSERLNKSSCFFALKRITDSQHRHHAAITALQLLLNHYSHLFWKGGEGSKTNLPAPSLLPACLYLTLAPADILQSSIMGKKRP